ncbi:MAG: nicotinamidase [Acidobacteriota bacterium]
MPSDFQSGDALLAVDVQIDFCPGGALAVREGDQVVAVLNRWIGKARQAGIPIFASRDWHPPGHVSFKERGGPWPVHCVRGTPGAEFHPALELPTQSKLISKATALDKDAYSAFEGTDLEQQLRQAGVGRIWIGGLTLDYCVKYSTLDALKAGFEVRVILAATRAVNLEPDDGRKALEEILSAGAALEEEAA